MSKSDMLVTLILATIFSPLIYTLTVFTESYSISNDPISIIRGLGIFLLIIYLLVVILLYIENGKKYYFNIKSGTKFLFLQSLKILAALLYFYSMILISKSDAVIIYISLISATYILFLAISLIFSYRRVSILVHLKYVKSLLDEFLRNNDDKKIQANKLKAVTSILLLKEKLINNFNSRFSAKYILEFTNVENLELLAAKILWLDVEDQKSIEEIVNLLNDAIEKKVDIYPDTFKFDSFMKSIKELINEDWELQDKITGKYHKNILFTVIPVIIAIINLIPILLRYL